MDAPWIWLFIPALLGLWVLLTYNSLINRRNQLLLAFSTVDVQLKKRHDLVPNLVEVVKGYATHEREVLEAVTQARQQASQLGATWDSQENLTAAVGQLIARAEAYPDLKASSQFLMLQRQLSECEAQIAAARRSHTSSIMDYNNSVEMFPSSIIAGMFGFRREKEFEIAIQERSAPNVRF